jgi:hypothetical protein
MSSKPQPTIASLVREAAKSETSFLNTLNEVLDDDEPERLEEFFARLNIPRSVKGDDPAAETEARNAGGTISVTTFEQEIKLTEGIQKFLDRHLRKIRWHVSHPSLDGAQNCVRLYRAMATVTELRIRRVLALLDAHPSLTVEEWGQARELLNRAYREIREATSVISTSWVESLMSTSDPDDVRQALAELPEAIGQTVKLLKDLREMVEERRARCEVRPENYPPVRPPRYFGGDLIDVRSWRHYWGDLSAMNDNLKTALHA